jgi:hypothetical protein
VIRPGAVFALVAAMLLCVSVSTVLGQVSEGVSAVPTATRIFRPPAGEIIGPPDWPLIVGPFGPAFNPRPSPSPFNVTPTLSIREEYNDNIFLNNGNRRDDFITAITPGVRAFFQQPGYHVFIGYDLYAEMYAKHDDLSNVGDRQNFLLDASYEWSSRLTLTLSDAFVRTYNTSQTSAQGIATGRAQVTTNTLAPGLAYILTPRDTVRLVASYAITKVDQADESALNSSSKAYGLDTTLDRVLTPRLTGTIGYQVRRFDFEVAEDSTVQTLRIGASYQITPLLTASVTGGASIETTNGRGTDVGPAASVSLTQQFSFGAATLTYNRSVGTAGALGQATDNQSIGASLVATSLLPGFSLTVAPRFNTAESSTVNVKTFTADLIASYHLTRDVSVFGSYTLLHQRASGSVGAGAGDIDQNRLFVGLQIRYPIDLY